MKNVRPLPSVLVSTLIASAALLTSPTSAVAGMQWKWKDAAGAIQYSDRPPPNGTPEKDILSRPAAARAAATATAKPAADPSTPAASASAASKPEGKATDPELEAKRKKAEDEKKAAQKVEEEKAAKNRAENCQRAKSYQRTLNDGIRISRTNANGEREILDDKGRADEQRQVEEIIRNNCN
ncbi:MAG: DUF4124 domain-containing protein [Burkholderiales bacterium]|nr:DUF4124 domain-containing protein [Burkholderiales bacterium]